MSEQHAFFVLVSQKQCTLAGVVSFDTARYGALCSQHTGRAFGRALAGLERKRFVVCDKRTREIFIRTFVKHDGVLRSPNAIVAMTRDFERIVSPAIRAAFIAELGEGFREGIPEGVWPRLEEGFRKGFLEGFPEPRVRAEPPASSLLTTPLTPPTPSAGSNGTNPRTRGTNPRAKAVAARRELIPDWQPEPQPACVVDPDAITAFRTGLPGPEATR